MSLQLQFVRGRDQASPTSILTGVAKTRLNGDQSLTTPNEARNLIGIMPGCAPNAALTAAQTMLTKFEVESKAVKDIMPKAIVACPVMGGLGTFPMALVPALMVFPFNTPLSGNEDIDYFGTPLVANTAAPDAWADVIYSNMRANPQKEPHTFWDGPTNETSTGVAAADGVLGEAFTVNAPRQAILRYLYTVLGTGVVTASESFIATGLVTSNDFATSMPMKGSAQPIASALGTAIGIGVPNNLLHDIYCPCKPTTRVQTQLNMQEAQTAAGNFYVGVGYYRN